MLINWLRRLWHCALNSSKSTTGSLATDVSVDFLFTLLSPVLSPTRPWSVLAEWSLGVVRPLVDRCPGRTPSLRGLFREDLGVLWVDILRRLVVTACHPDLVVRVERSPPLSAVSPGEDWLSSSAVAAGFSLKVNWVLRESPLPPCIFAMKSWLVLCVHNLLLRRSGYQHVGTVLPMGVTSTTADNLWANWSLSRISIDLCSILRVSSRKRSDPCGAPTNTLFASRLSQMYWRSSLFGTCYSCACTPT